jgi:hypothetical protein
VFNKTSLALCLTAILCTTSVVRAESGFYQPPHKSTSKRQVERYEPFAYVGRYRDDPPGAAFQTRGMHRPD